jgi:hypothetical protein
LRWRRWECPVQGPVLRGRAEGEPGSPGADAETPTLQRARRAVLSEGIGDHVLLCVAEDPQVSFAGERILVRLKTHAKLGTNLRGACLGVSLAPTSEVSVAPDADGETLGWDARLERVSDQRELNFLLTAFLGHTVPSNMKVNAADLLRKALQDSTATAGYKVTLERLKIHSVQITGDDVVVDVDGGISVK